jgi:hypothetical protein
LSELTKKKQHERLQKVNKEIKHTTDKVLEKYNVDQPYSLTFDKTQNYENNVIMLDKTICGEEELDNLVKTQKLIIIQDRYNISDSNVDEMAKLLKEIPRSWIRKREKKKLNEEVERRLKIHDLEKDRGCWVEPADMIAEIVKKRNIKDKNLEIVVQGDGRGLGKTRGETIIALLLKNEKEKVTETDHLYVIAVVNASENNEDLTPLINPLSEQLAKLQQEGIMIVSFFFKCIYFVM